MIDIHNHILPGLDDGARDIDESLAMAKIAVDDGIHSIIATPHVMTGVYQNNKEKIIQAADDFNHILDEEKIALRVYPGAEYYLEPELPQQLDREELLTLNNNGRYLLVELSSHFIADNVNQLLYQLQLKGISPIIAHPERNSSIQSNPHLLSDMISRGIYAQLTAGSITGQFGSSIKRISLRFLKQGCTHLIASDAHSLRERTPRLSKSYEFVKDELGENYAQIIFNQNPIHLQNAEELIIPELPKTKSPKPRGRFLRLKR